MLLRLPKQNTADWVVKQQKCGLSSFQRLESPKALAAWSFSGGGGSLSGLQTARLLVLSSQGWGEASSLVSLCRKMGSHHDSPTCVSSSDPNHLGKAHLCTSRPGDEQMKEGNLQSIGVLGKAAGAGSQTAMSSELSVKGEGRAEGSGLAGKGWSYRSCLWERNDLMFSLLRHHSFFLLGSEVLYGHILLILSIPLYNLPKSN